MRIEILENENSVAEKAAKFIAQVACEAIQQRGRFIVAVSGGKTPWVMLRALANENIQWNAVHIFQVDERIAPDGDPDRNLTHLHQSLSEVLPLLKGRIHAMPVTHQNLHEGALQYSSTLHEIAGKPAVIDLVHLGLGSDGHTASLVPGDPVLEIANTEVAVTGLYLNRQRMTLTYPIINRARNILWVATGDGKREMLQRLLNNDKNIPAGRVVANNALILADEAAADGVDCQL